MRGFAIVLSLVLSSAPLAGCGLIVRGSDFLTDGGGGSQDGGTDAEVDGGPDVPHAPLASGVGLSSYRPLLGETLRAIIGPVYDEDGDTIRTELVWFRNGEQLEVGGLSVMLDPAAGFAPGDQLRVELRVSDATLEGTPVSAGPAIIEADEETRWRMLLPPRASAASLLRAFDPGRQRNLYAVRLGEHDYGLWEQQLSANAPRWVRLYPSGAPPIAAEGSVFYDGAGQRFLVFGGRAQREGGGDTLHDTLYALEMQNRGAERWIELSGNRPSARATSSITTSDDGTTAWLYGGMNDSAEPLDDLWELDLANGNFRQLASALGSPGVGGALVHDAENDRLIRVGVATIDLSGGPVPSNNIDVIDLSADPPALEQVATLPTPLLGPLGFIEDDTLYVVGGFGPDGLNDQVFEIDLESFEVTARTLAGGASFLLPTATRRAPFADDLVITGLSDLDNAGANFWSIDEEAQTVGPISVGGRDLPGPVAQGSGFVRENGDLMVVGGRSMLSGGSTLQDVWRVNVDGTWSRAAPMAGPDGSPELRHGIVVDGSSNTFHDTLWQAFGAGPSGLADATAWYAHNQWRRLMPISGSPQGRVGHAVFPGRCRDSMSAGMPGNALGVFGGRNPSTNTMFNDTWMLRCNNEPDVGSCQWRNLSAANSPTQREWAPIAAAGWDIHSFDRMAFVFGGRGPAGAVLDDVWTFDACNDAPWDWEPVEIEGAQRPPPLFGHSASSMLPARREGLPEDVQSTVLIFGGGTHGDNDEARETHDELWVFRAQPGTFGNITGSFTPVVVPNRPPPRMWHVAVWDQPRQRLLVYGGAANRRVLDDLWELRWRESD